MMRHGTVVAVAGNGRTVTWMDALRLSLTPPQASLLSPGIHAIGKKIQIGLERFPPLRIRACCVNGSMSPLWNQASDGRASGYEQNVIVLAHCANAPHTVRALYFPFDKIAC